MLGGAKQDNHDAGEAHEDRSHAQRIVSVHEEHASGVYGELRFDRCEACQYLGVPLQNVPDANRLFIEAGDQKTLEARYCAAFVQSRSFYDVPGKHRHRPGEG